MKRFFLIVLIICLSSSFVFADGFTTTQASNITNELTYTATSNTIKYYIQKIFDQLYTGGSTSIRQYLINISNAVTDSSSSNSLLKRVIDIYALINNRTQMGNYTLMDYLSNLDSNVASFVDNGFNIGTYSALPLYLPYRYSLGSDFQFYNNTFQPYSLSSTSSSPSSLTLRSNPTAPTSLAGWLYFLNNELVFSVSSVKTLGTSYFLSPFNFDDFSTDSVSISSVLDALSVGFDNLMLSTGRLSAFLVDDVDLELKESNADLNDEVKENLLTPGRGSSLSIDDVRGFSAVVGGVRGFSTGSVEASDAFDVFDDDSDTWLFFSQDVLDDMNTVDNSDDDSDPGRGGLRLLSSPQLTPSSYDLYLEEVFNELD